MALGIDVRTTLLAAHAVPTEFAGRADAWIDAVCDDIVPAAARARLADAVDAFCDTIGFTREHSLHFATRRLWAWREQFGSDAWWAAALGRAAIAGGAGAFWPAVTRRRFDALDPVAAPTA